MTTMKQSPIFEKTEAFLDWLLPLTSQFPRHHRFGLARRTEDRALNFYEQIVRAAKAAKPGRFLYEADVQLTQLRFYLRRCRSLALLSHAPAPKTKRESGAGRSIVNRQF